MSPRWALTAGDWDVEGNVVFTPTGAVTDVSAGVSMVSAASLVPSRPGSRVRWALGCSTVSGTGGADAGERHVH